MSKSYKVLSVSQRDKITPDNRVVTVYVIAIETSRGGVGSLEVPEKDYTPERLPELIAEKVAMLDAPFKMAEME